MVGSKYITSTPLTTGGYILLGHETVSYTEGEQFGGQLLNLNVFAKELSAAEIAELYDGGLCSDLEKKHQEARIVTWESILSESRNGNVQEVDDECPATEEETEDEPESDEAHSISALEFGSTFSDYVKFYPDMSSAKHAITVCSWVRKQLSGDMRSWFDYVTTKNTVEFLISDNGWYNFIQNKLLDVRAKVTVPLNTWTHQCNTWGTKDGILKVYYNGTMVGSKYITSTPLTTGGYILLGHETVSYTEGEQFGGQLLNLNVFAKELSAAEIAELYDGGLCSDLEKKHQEARIVTWESILSESRNGNVQEVDDECPATEEETEDEPESDEAHSISALDFGSTFSDYVKFYPDMSLAKHAITVCSWVKKQLTGDKRTWFSYVTTEDHQGYGILISDNGWFNHIQNKLLDVRAKVTVPLIVKETAGSSVKKFTTKV